MQILIASFNFSPGHLSHMIAWYKLFREIGHDSNLLLHKDYGRLIEEELDIEYFDPSHDELLETLRADVLLIHNPGIKNHRIAEIFKKNGVRIIYVYHEPWHSFREYLKEGMKQTFIGWGAHYFSTKVLSLADVVVVPSQFALKLYKVHDIKYNKKVFVIPLLFDDEAANYDLSPEKKTYFSYIGTACKGHAFDQFLSFVQSYDEDELINIPYKFQIATRTDISRFMNEKLSSMEKHGILRIVQGRPLRNSEINQAYAISFAVWNVYNRSTQSGILPKALMFGACPIATNIGSFPEFIQDGENGFLIDNVDFQRLKEVLLTAFENKNKMAKNCRSSFLRTFHFANHVSKCKQLLERIFTIT